MVLISFSIPNHINLIKQGLKNQTTRIPRAYSVGDKVQLYYKPRQKKDCWNCIQSCGKHLSNPFHDARCELGHTNFFGESTITEILHYWDAPYKENGNEIWMGCTIGHLDDKNKNAWAVADGFESGWIAADTWFAISTGNPNWADQNLDVIIWKPIIARGQQK